MEIKNFFVQKKNDVVNFVKKNEEIIFIGIGTAISIGACYLSNRIGLKEGFETGFNTGSKSALNDVEAMLKDHSPDVFDEVDSVIKEHGENYHLRSNH